MSNIKQIKVGTTSYDITAKQTTNKLSIINWKGSSEYSFDGSTPQSIYAITETELNTLLNKL